METLHNILDQLQHILDEELEPRRIAALERSDVEEYDGLVAVVDSLDDTIAKLEELV